MIKSLSVILLVVTIFITLLEMPAAVANMSSANYTVTTTASSGGGGPMASANYQMTCTLGQPSPLVDPVMPPQSTNYELLTGFWYTIGVSAGCLYDYVSDGDVDGTDLVELANAFSIGELAVFAMEFGRVDCLP